MLARLYQRLASLTLGLWLMGGVMALLASGSVAAGEGSGINEMPLFAWLGAAPFALTWWLWGTLALLALLVVNTLLCSVEALRRRAGKSGPVALLAPQLMHLGFLFIVLAHLLSASGGAHEALQVEEGAVIGFPDGSTVRVAALDAVPGPMGMPSDYRAQLLTASGGRETAVTVSPNHPLFHGGFGIYLKQVELVPYRAALLEIHREPGASWALVGALFFTAGNVALLFVRRERR